MGPQYQASQQQAAGMANGGEVKVTNDGKGNTFHDSTKNTWYDHTSNKGAFKVNVMGNVGDNFQSTLLNLNDIDTLNLNDVNLVNLVDYPMRSGIHITNYKGNNIHIGKNAVFGKPEILMEPGLFKDIHFDDPYFNKIIAST